MGVRISAQLLLFAQSILLGLCAGAVYGVLRPIRRLSPRLAVAADFLYALSAAAAGSAFLLRPADGILRGYMALGALGGAALWFCGFDVAARPLWVFWTEAALWLLSLALLPVKLAVRALICLWESGRNLLYLQEKRRGIRFGYTRRHQTAPRKRRQPQRNSRNGTFPSERRRQPQRNRQDRQDRQDRRRATPDARNGSRNRGTGTPDGRTSARNRDTGTPDGRTGAQDGRTAAQKRGKTGGRENRRSRPGTAKRRGTRHGGAERASGPYTV